MHAYLNKCSNRVINFGIYRRPVEEGRILPRGRTTSYLTGRSKNVVCRRADEERRISPRGWRTSYIGAFTASTWPVVQLGTEIPSFFFTFFCVRAFLYNKVPPCSHNISYMLIYGALGKNNISLKSYFESLLTRFLCTFLRSLRQVLKMFILLVFDIVNIFL